MLESTLGAYWFARWAARMSAASAERPSQRMTHAARSPEKDRRTETPERAADAPCQRDEAALRTVALRLAPHDHIKRNRSRNQQPCTREHAANDPRLGYIVPHDAPRDPSVPHDPCHNKLSSEHGEQRSNRE